MSSSFYNIQSYNLLYNITYRISLLLIDTLRVNNNFRNRKNMYTANDILFRTHIKARCPV